MLISNLKPGILESKLEAHCIDTGREFEAIMARDEYLASFAELQFRNGLISVPQYFNMVCDIIQLIAIPFSLMSYFVADGADKPQIDQTYTLPAFNTTPEALVKKAESYISFHNNVLPSESANSRPLSWNALSTAISHLTAASKLPDVENVAAVHILRGNVEMLRYRMGRQSVSFLFLSSFSSRWYINPDIHI